MCSSGWSHSNSWEGKGKYVFVVQRQQRKSKYLHSCLHLPCYINFLKTLKKIRLITNFYKNLLFLTLEYCLMDEILVKVLPNCLKISQTLRLRWKRFLPVSFQLKFKLAETSWAHSKVLTGKTSSQEQQRSTRKGKFWLYTAKRAETNTNRKKKISRKRYNYLSMQQIIFLTNLIPYFTNYRSHSKVFFPSLFLQYQSGSVLVADRVGSYSCHCPVCEGFLFGASKWEQIFFYICFLINQLHGL